MSHSPNSVNFLQEDSICIYKKKYPYNIPDSTNLEGYFSVTEQNRTLLKTMHLKPLTGGVRD